jgi:hypothetical protein
MKPAMKMIGILTPATATTTACLTGRGPLASRFHE